MRIPGGKNGLTPVVKKVSPSLFHKNLLSRATYKSLGTILIQQPKHPHLTFSADNFELESPGIQRRLLAINKLQRWTMTLGRPLHRKCVD